MSKIVKYTIFIVVIAALGFVFYNKVYIPKHTFETMQLSKGDLNKEVFGIGEVGAKNIYTINAQTGGKILQITTDEGKWVKKGDLLAVIDAVDLPQLIEEAKMSVYKADSELQATQKELDSLFAQKVLAKLTYDRYKKLKEKAFVSQSEYDKAKADLDTIRANIKAIQAHIDSSKTEVVRLQKSLEALSVKLSRYKIYAPVDGYVISKDAEVAQSVAGTQPILKVVDPKTVWIKAYIDEKISGDVKVGQRAVITLRSQSNKKLSGHVSRIVAQSDAVTQEREVDVSFDKSPIPFYMNEQAEVLIMTERFKNVLKIPADLIVYQGEKAGVWVEQNRHAHFLHVKIIALTDKQAAVENLDENTKLLMPDKNKKSLSEGMRIY
ncbi:efflux RND transporter periplasmic adaptor subunit [Sulfurimonas autotrophica]|uniref:Efflux transporter, RND family, MFP subunit n=1 Tax=Sulfurimonas autotrophica (strain ATCC BAA-671 / DSM 16294 / JCM 11897 / OK10) TaxID=563040 RepID=E0UTT1_SULAO|nr:efflux RND transporter periplasmic adaptor subunit [Sulfurimonas autotrophica]ADN09375.1 efflux transporter, RND family, MFP subunit [Sulfurimonas autotrophica DSM 16294]